MGGGEVEGLDERRQVVDVLVEGALAGRRLALAVAAAVVRHYPEPLGKLRDHQVPVVVVPPRAVHEHDRIALTGELVEDLHAVRFGKGHPKPLL